MSFFEYSVCGAEAAIATARRGGDSLHQVGGLGAGAQVSQLVSTVLLFWLSSGNTKWTREVEESWPPRRTLSGLGGGVTSPSDRRSMMMMMMMRLVSGGLHLAMDR